MLQFEPFHLKFWEIARLTDWQIIHKLILPAVARQAAQERAQKGLPPAVDESEEPGPDWKPDRQQMMSVMVGMLGMTPAQAAAEYEAQERMNAQKR